MQLTPEILIEAIHDYCHLSNKKKKLTNEQIEWFAEPENVFLMIFFTVTAPDEIVVEVKKDIHPWIETAISQLQLTVAKLPPQAKEEIEKVIEQIFAHAHEYAMVNKDWLLLVLATLKKNEFNINTNVTNLAAVNPADPVAERPDLKTLLTQSGIDSAIEFIELFEENLNLIPVEALPLIFGELESYSWAIDALLLLTQYHDENIALAGAQALDQYSPKKWEQLSTQQLLNLSVRFNCHPSVKAYFKKWQKHAMRYSKANQPAKINELYLTHIDGNDCATLMMSIIINGRENQINTLFDTKSGIRETLVNLDSATTLQDTIEQINEQEEHILEVEFTETEPASLATILPWMLSIQQEKKTPVDLNSLYWLSQLPVEWTQPEPFNLDNWDKKLDYQVNPHRLERSRRSHSIGNSIIMTWQAPAESILAAKKPRDLLKLYYYPNKDIFAARLAYSAAIRHYQIGEEITYEENSDGYLDLAHALYDPGINRKRFELFESLAEVSFDEFIIAQHDSAGLEEFEPQGLVVKIMLQDASPAVWRRVHLSNQFTLDDMHDIIQIAMGWENCHLFAFSTKGRMIPEESYQHLQLASFLTSPNDEIGYHYDFGDDWHHVIRLEKILKQDIELPKVTAGSGICPAEDSGGIWGWNQLLKMRKKKNLTEDDLEHLEWVGLSPDEPLLPFNKEEANQRLDDDY
ncbi:MAG: plasmid pRiA4b ORF-3 family protein [Psychromonas sp.]